ncbi:hypothetical protein Q3G72_018028 [Acer saccharum]|nr:hypothetical protein Q3G72_018028 [Acer saccharum]
MLFVQGRGKDDYLTSVVIAPGKKDPNFKTWKAENSMVMSWLINSINNEISEDFMFYETAKEIRDAVKETYSNNKNTVELFAIKSNIKYKKIVDKERIFKFLVGLNKDLDEVRGRILGIQPLLSIREAFFEV